MQKLNDIFTNEELDLLEQALSNAEDRRVHDGMAPLGRLEVNRFRTPTVIKDKILEAVEEFAGTRMILRSASCVVYSNEYGQPNLPPHFDGDKVDLIVDFQISSNTDWPIGLGMEVYKMEDNSALIFNPNTNIHWRPLKDFKDGEYVKMLFLRFGKENLETDYSHKALSQDHPIFKEVVEFRESLGLVSK